MAALCLPAHAAFGVWSAMQVLRFYNPVQMVVAGFSLGVELCFVVQGVPTVLFWSSHCCDMLCPTVLCRSSYIS